MLGASALPEEAPTQPPIDGDSLKRKARLGAIALGLRTVLVQLTVFGGNVFLYRLLDPADFGAFAIVQFALSFFAYFGDAGLGAALIQKKEEPTRQELSSVWFLQIALTLIVVVVVFLGAPTMIRFWPDMPASGAWLLRALSVNLLLTTLRVIPAILMERHLQFGRLAVLEVILNVSFYTSATILALMGWGVRALVGAVLVQGVLGAVGVFVMRPWKPSLCFDMKALRPLVRFGLYFQGKGVLGFITGAISPVFGGRVLGQYAVGLLSWAQATAFFPLQIVNIVSRITFPLYSRMQADRQLFSKALQSSVHLTCLITLGFVGAFIGLGPNLVHVVFTDKWVPALPLLYVYSVGIAIGFLTPIVSTALDATGRASVSLRIATLTTVLIWVLVPIGAFKWGSIGFAAAYSSVMWIGNLVMIGVLTKLVPGSQLWHRVRGPVVGAVVMAALGKYAIQPWANGAISLTLGLAVAIAAFLGTSYLVDPAGMKEVWHTVRNRSAKKPNDEPAPVAVPELAPAASNKS